MGNINRDYIESYIRDLLPETPHFLKDLEVYAEENHIPIVHPEVAQLLKVLIMIKKPKNILEVGTAIGYSAIVMAESMDNYGNIITIERRDDMVKIASENIKNKGFDKKIKILNGDALDILPTLNKKFDFIFLDAAKGKYKEFLPYCINNLVDGGILVSDNVLFRGMVANDDLVIRRKKTIVKRMREYLRYISNKPNLETSIIPIGDGVALTYKKEENQ
ncbi:O-methyltransferase [Thermohalobacter berrensis]|uniref:tRNA 5-hydroxyuridine methyltransferase n=1 Tax=Thermohalobacter berrensis TaxID=99594 RepID=A0A419TAT7_9FIRM|nr:O-methyltransferase [Thermohalobacter berrensis]RKD34604.1 methyltransferase [Thermohalobacter berrensis]